MKKRLLLKFSIISLVLQSGFSQKNQIRLDHAPSAFSIDTEGKLYLGFQNGDLRNFSGEEESPVFSLPNQSEITAVEAQNNRKIFLFYRDIQQVTILDRFSALPINYNIQDLGLSFAQFACASQDGLFWIFENNPQRIVKIDPLRNFIVHF